jgi:hypothetical protein
VNGQTSKSASVVPAISPASRRRGVLSVRSPPQIKTPVATAAHVLAANAIAREARNTVATSTNGPVI